MKHLRLVLALAFLLSLTSCVRDHNKSQDNSDYCSSQEITSSIEEVPSEPMEYKVSFINYDDSLLYETWVEEGNEATYVGEEPTREEDDEFTYEFTGWDVELTNIHATTVAKAEFKANPKEDWGPIHWA